VSGLFTLDQLSSTGIVPDEPLGCFYQNGQEIFFTTGRVRNPNEPVGMRMMHVAGPQAFAQFVHDEDAIGTPLRFAHIGFKNLSAPVQQLPQRLALGIYVHDGDVYLKVQQPQGPDVVNLRTFERGSSVRHGHSTTTYGAFTLVALDDDDKELFELGSLAPLVNPE